MSEVSDVTLFYSETGLVVAKPGCEVSNADARYAGGDISSLYIADVSQAVIKISESNCAQANIYAESMPCETGPQGCTAMMCLFDARPGFHLHARRLWLSYTDCQ